MHCLLLVECECGEKFLVDDDEEGDLVDCPECGEEVLLEPESGEDREYRNSSTEMDNPFDFLPIRIFVGIATLGISEVIRKLF